MIEYKVTVKCNGCAAEIISVTVPSPEQIKVTILEWRSDWRVQGLRMDKFRKDVVYCAACSSSGRWV